MAVARDRLHCLNNFLVTIARIIYSLYTVLGNDVEDFVFSTIPISKVYNKFFLLINSNLAKASLCRKTNHFHASPTPNYNTSKFNRRILRSHPCVDCGATFLLGLG